MFTLTLSPLVQQALVDLKKSDARRLKKVVNALSQLEQDPQHPKLRSRPVRGAEPTEWGSKVWFADVENHTPNAWRMTWAYGPNKDEIFVAWMGPHP